MTVKEFVDVVNYTVIDYAKIYERQWNEDYQSYDSVYTGKRVNSKKDLAPYYECELEGFDLYLLYGEYDDSEIWITMPKDKPKEC